MGTCYPLFSSELGDRALSGYHFAYSFDVSVVNIDLPDAVPPEVCVGSPALTVTVHGTAFLPVHDDGLRCRYSIGVYENFTSDSLD